MLLYITDYLMQFHSGFGVFQYLTLRAILGILTALVISFIVGPVMIRKLSHYQIGQHVRDDGPFGTELGCTLLETAWYDKDWYLNQA